MYENEDHEDEEKGQFEKSEYEEWREDDNARRFREWKSDQMGY